MKLKYTAFQIALEITALLLLISFCLFLYVQWEHLPQKIPVHFNAWGEIDRWGNKQELLLLPAVGVGIYLLLTVAAFFPQTWNIPIRITPENQEAVYLCVKSTLLLIKVEVLAMLFYIAFYAANARALPMAFLPVILILLTLTTLFPVIWLHAGKR